MGYKKFKTTLQFLNSHASHWLFIGLIGLGLRFYRSWQKKIDKISQMEEDFFPLSPIEQQSSSHLVTLLVAAWNEEAYIEDFLISFADVDYPKKELILVAGGSDSTFRIAQLWAGSQITVLEQRVGEGKQRALQRAYGIAHGDIIFLTDADCLLNSEGFKRMIDPIISGRECVVTGRIRPLPHQLSNAFVYAQWSKRQFETMLSNRERYVSSLVGGNSAIVHSLLGSCWADASNQPIGEDHYPAVCIIHNPRFADSGSMYSLYCARNIIHDSFLLLESDLLYEERALSILLESEAESAILVSGLTESGEESGSASSILKI